MDESLKGEWWWYGHWGESGKTQAKEINKLVREGNESSISSSSDDLFDSDNNNSDNGDKTSESE